SDGYLVAETMNCARKLDSFRGVYRLEEDRLWTGRELAPDHYVEAVPERQHVLLQSVWDANYGHWLWDTLSRIQLVKEAKLPGDPIWVINEPREAMRSIVYDTLLLAGIRPDDVMEHDNSTGQFESVYIPAALTVHPIIKSP
ncbi:glycosyltransferase family 61 protein, partial [Staphylococcus hyicus]|nr:glycosyltransferase family 61 protein [Staphylococcus hyicus]